MNKLSNILIIEDEVITAMSLVMDLKKNGYKNVKFARNGTMALSSSKESFPDLIIADVSLSDGESGIEVATEISGSSGIPIIITSGYEAGDLALRMNILKNAHFLRKPVMISSLIKLIESL